MHSISERLESIRGSIVSAAARAGRNASDVRLVAVSKKQSADAIREAGDAGQLLFGESRVQEAEEKIPQLPSRFEWHFVGHVQKNKTRRLLPLCSVIHSVDSLELAEQIDRVAAECGAFPKVLLQVNVAGEERKFGFSPEDARRSLDRLLELERVETVGLMVIPPLERDPEKSRVHFTALRELRDDLAECAGVALPELSMGMSGDYEIAIEEGATLVRIGTSIFGSRRA